MSNSKSICRLLIIFFFTGINFNCTSQQANKNTEREHIVLISKITLPKVKGRIDHITYDPLNHLAFVAALGNNSVEVIDIHTQQVVHTITGLHEPQGIMFIPSSNTIVVANGNGNCVFLDEGTYKEIGSVDLQTDADNVRYDSASHLLYVGYGSGNIAVVDPKLMKQIAGIPLDDHPESFQFSRIENRMYINVPDAGEIEVADLSSKTIIAKWKNTGATSNFPMALDESNNHLFIGYRNPGTLRMINALTGKEISSVNCTEDADDVFYYDSLVFVSAGKGFVDVFRANQSELTQVNHLATVKGARTSLLLPSERKFLLAAPAHNGEPAALWVYRLQ